MKPTTLLKLSAGMLAFIGVGHTIGHFTWSDNTAAGKAVLDAMAGHRFPVGLHEGSYRDFYDGFSLSVSLLLFLTATLTWCLAAAARRDPATLRPALAVSFAGQLVFAALCWRYFPLPPAICATIGAALVAVAGALVLSRREAVGTA